MRRTSYEERIMISTLSAAGHSDGEIAQQVGWGIATVGKWRRRHERQGRVGLVAKVGRPESGALSSFAPELVACVRALRQAHPGWGAKTLRARLQSEENWPVLPSRASLARWLKAQGLVRRYERHQALPQPSRTDAQAPHEEWELDARGCEKIAGVGVVSLLNLNDRFSKVKLCSYPCWLGEQRAQRHPNTVDYQLVFRLTASEWGLPDRLRVDRESVFYDNGSQSPFPTLFHLWLLALRVDLIFGPPHQPTQRGLTERSHQTWYHQVLEGQSFAGQEGLAHALRQHRHFLNWQLPCASLAETPPLVAYPQALIPRRLYRPEWEAEILELAPIYAYLSQGRWFRKASHSGAISLGAQTYSLGLPWVKKDVDITFDPADQHLLFFAPDGNLQRRLPIKGITKADLMGPLGPLVQLHGFQLALPFSWHDWQVLQLCETLPATTY